MSPYLDGSAVPSASWDMDSSVLKGSSRLLHICGGKTATAMLSLLLATTTKQ